MNNLFYLTVFAVCLAASYGIIPIVQAAPSADSSEQFLVGHESYNRVVRQSGYPPNDFPPPPPPQMWAEDISRKKREAKGVGGSMPTRKG